MELPQAHLLVERLGARDRGRMILDGVCFEVTRGQTMALLGPPGSGKTALLHLLAGFLPPLRGTVRLAGRDITMLRPERRDIALVFATDALFPHMPVLDNVGFALKMRGLRREARRRLAGETLATLGLAHLAELHPARLDAGARRLVALARAAAAGSALLLVDEPSEPEEPARRDRFRRALGDVVASAGVTALFATHDRAAAFALADRAALLRDGRVEQIGTPRQLYEQPASAFVARFTGGCNLLPASLLHERDGMAVISLAGRAAHAACPRNSRAGPAMLSLRPHRVRPDPEGPLRGIVTTVAYEGALTRVTMRGDAGECVAELTQAPPGLAVGGELALGWSAGEAWLIPGGAT